MWESCTAVRCRLWFWDHVPWSQGAGLESTPSTAASGAAQSDVASIASTEMWDAAPHHDATDEVHTGLRHEFRNHERDEDEQPRTEAFMVIMELDVLLEGLKSRLGTEALPA